MRPKRGPYRVRRHEVVQPLDQSYRLIPLTQGQNAIVDAEDFEWLSQWNWIAQWSKFTKSFYARISAEPHKPMHRVILHCKSKKEVDHWNHDTLDNRKQNLRECTKTEQARNRKIRSDNTSGFKGLCLKPDGKWEVYISVDGKRKYIGKFPCRENAARAYDQAAQKYHREFAHLNFQKC